MGTKAGAQKKKRQQREAIKRKGTFKEYLSDVGQKASRIRQPRNQQEWSLMVRARDNYTCQDCGSKKNLTAHHVKKKVKHKNRRFSVKNGITLCRDCHDKREGNFCPKCFNCGRELLYKKDDEYTLCECGHTVYWNK